MELLSNLLSKQCIALVFLATTLGIVFNIVVSSPQLHKSWEGFQQHAHSSTLIAGSRGSGPKNEHAPPLSSQGGTPRETTHDTTQQQEEGSIGDRPTESSDGNGGGGEHTVNVSEQDHIDPTSVGSSPNTIGFKWELAWQQSVRLAAVIDDEMEKGGKRLADGVEGIMSTLKSDSSSGASSCSFPSNQMKLSRLDYTHRRKRKGELTNDQMYRAVLKVSESLPVEGGQKGDDSQAKKKFGFFTSMSPALLDSLNHYPPAFSDRIPLETPFGSWKSSFHKIPEDFHELHGNELPATSLKLYKSPQLIASQPPAYVGAFANSVISSGHLMTCSGHVLSSGGCLWEFRRPAAPVETLTRVPVGIALCDEWCKGFYHFTHEHLPRVALIYQLLQARKDSYLVLSHAPNTFQLQFFSDILGIPRDRIVHGKAIRAEVGVYPMPMRCGNTFTHVLYMIRNLVWERLKLETDSFSNGQKRHHAKKIRFLFAERRKLSRMPTNYHDLKDRLKVEFGNLCNFDTTVGETSASVQVKLFHDADVVLGPHGANIANMMWMRHGSHVIEMASAKKGNMCYYTTASRVNITHQLLLHDQGKDSKYTVDYDELRSHVLHALRAVKKKFGLAGVGDV